MNLALYADHRAYYSSSYKPWWTSMQSKVTAPWDKTPPKVHRVPLGGLGASLTAQVEPLAFEWLVQVDAALCKAFCVAREDDVDVANVQIKLANAIARRLTGTFRTTNAGDDDLLDDRLFAMLTELAIQGRPCAFSKKLVDLERMRMMRVLLAAPGGSDANAILASRTSELIEFALDPPSELDPRPFIFQTLVDVVGQASCVESRVHAGTLWACSRDASAVPCLDDAIARVEAWEPPATCDTSLLLRSAPLSNRDVQLPTPAFVDKPDYFVARGKRPRRRGVGDSQLRRENLVRVVLEATAYDFFTLLVVRADVVEPVAQEAARNARCNWGLLDNVRRFCNTGTRMSCFVRKIGDMSGDHVRTVERAVCSMRWFTCKEIHTMLDTRFYPHMLLSDGITHGVRDRMYMHAHPEYKSFANDVIPVFMPIICHRRARLGIGFAARGGLLDALSTVPGFCEWHSATGPFVAGMAALRQAHPCVRDMLHRLSESSGLVRRVYKQTAKEAYCIDARVLSMLLQYTDRGFDDEA